MRLVETEHNKEKALLVQEKPTPFSRALIDKIKQYSIHLQTTSAFPHSFRDIDYMFIEQDTFEEENLTKMFESVTTKTLIMTEHMKVFEEFDELIRKNGLKHIKVVLVSPEDDNPDTIERVLWFLISDSEEVSLNSMRGILPKKQEEDSSGNSFEFNFSRRRLVAAAVFVLFAIHTLFIVPLALNGFFLYKAGTATKDQNFEKAETYLKTARPLMALTEATYVLARPGLQFMFLSVLPDNIVGVEKDALTFIDTSIDAAQNARTISSLLLDTKKSPVEVNDTRERINTLEQQVKTLEETSQDIRDTLNYDIAAVQEVQEDFTTISAYLQTSSRLVSHLDSLLADNAKKDYIIFFYNNMELRPGGGFIGSFAHAIFEDYTLKEFNVYDVYDADGQLTTHVRPPAPIRDYLDQPHWFLRDSNFSPDFEQNLKTAEFFLERELNLTDFDGGIAMTTTALSYILDAFGEVYVPDFQETITADNFYLKAQSQSEIDFFPGSNQKKSFLSTVGKTLLLELDQASPAKLGIAIKRALDEKHIVLITQDPHVQQDIDVLGWSGKVLNPQCVVSSSNCIINHILPVDANLGVNKANYFVNKLVKLKTIFNNDGSVENELSFSYTNNSPDNTFPGGTYKNYFQLYLPHNAIVQNIDINGRRVRNYDSSKTGVHRIVGTLVEISPKETVVLTVSYRLHDQVTSGDNAYQVVFQKQIGAFNNEFSLEVLFPDTMTITDQNFKSVAKNNSVFYNSTLSTNKVFVIEFIKE